MRLAAFIAFSVAMTCAPAIAAGPGGAEDPPADSRASIVGVAPTPQDPGGVLQALAGTTFGHVSGTPDGYSLLVRFEQDPQAGFRIVETAAHGWRTTTIAASQRGSRWRGDSLYVPLDMKARDRVHLADDGWLETTWSSMGSTDERGFRLLGDGTLERRSRNPEADPHWRLERLVPVDAERERILLDQIAIEKAVFDREVAEGVQALLAESAERRKRNREKFWEGVGQLAVALGEAAGEVMADRAAMSAAGSAYAPADAAPGTAEDPLASVDGSGDRAENGAVTSAPAAGAPLRFVMMISLMNLPGDTVNPHCYSNVVTRPGPPGWGAAGFLPTGSAAQARQAVEALKPRFIAACRASGREITSEGNFDWRWNQSPGDEEKVAGARPRYREDVTVDVD